jgi:hypothetical protein
MIRPVSVTLASLLFLLLFWTASARAEEQILKLVPEQALGFAVVNRPADADAKLQQLGRQLNLPIPSLLARLQGPDGLREGIEKNRPIALLVLPPKDETSPPAPILLIPVSDYAKFLEPFKAESAEAGVTKIELWGSTSVVRNIGGYAAITELLNREALEGLKPAGEVPAALASWRTWLAEKDAAAVVLAPGIRLLSAKVQEGIARIKPSLALAGGQAKQAAAALDMYVTLFRAAEKEVASVGFAAQLDAKGVFRFSKRARLVPGGDWAAFFAEAKPSKQNVLAGLPDEPFVFAGGGAISETMTRKLMDFSFALVQNLREMYGLSEEQSKTLSELAKEKFPGIRGVSLVLGAGQSGESIFARMLVVMRVKNSETFLVDYEKYLARYSQIAEKIKSPMFQPAQVEKTEIDGARALKITMSVPQMPNMPPESAKMIENMYGPGGKIVAWMVPCNEHTVVFGYMSQEPLRRAIAAIKQGKPGLAGNAGVADVAALLPSGATCSVYWSPKGIFDFASQMMAAVLPPGTGVKIPDFGPTPPVAMAVTTGPDEVGGELIVPAEVIKAIGRLVESQSNRNAPPPPSKEVEER